MILDVDNDHLRTVIGKLGEYTKTRNGRKMLIFGLLYGEVKNLDKASLDKLVIWINEGGEFPLLVKLES